MEWQILLLVVAILGIVLPLIAKDIKQIDTSIIVLSCYTIAIVLSQVIVNYITADYHLIIASNYLKDNIQKRVSELLHDNPYVLRWEGYLRAERTRMPDQVMFRMWTLGAVALMVVPGIAALAVGHLLLLGGKVAISANDLLLPPDMILVLLNWLGLFASTVYGVVLMALVLYSVGIASRLK